MADIPRTRMTAGVAGGPPTAVADPEVRRLIAELQSEIAALKQEKAVTPPEIDVAPPVVSPMRHLPDVAPAVFPARPMMIAKCRNVGADTILRYEPVVLTGPDTDPDAPTMNSLPLFDCMQAGSEAVPFAVALADIPVEGIGDVCVGGLTIAFATGTTGWYASYDPSVDPYNLVVGDAGPGEVVWCNGTYALVRFPTGSGGGSGGQGIWKVDTYSELVAIEEAEEGDLGFVRDTDTYYGYYNGTWHELPIYSISSTATSIGAATSGGLQTVHTVSRGDHVHAIPNRTAHYTGSGTLIYALGGRLYLTLGDLNCCLSHLEYPT